MCTEDGQNDTIKVDNNTYYLPVLKEAIDNIGYDDYDIIYNSSNSKTAVKHNEIYSARTQSELLAKSSKNVKEDFEDAKKQLAE